MSATLVSPFVDGPLARRLAGAAGVTADAAVAELAGLADEARSAPGFDMMASICRTLADPHRLLLASLVKRRPRLTAVELQAAVGLSQATVSHHMRALVDSGLVQAERLGRWVHYRLDGRFERLVP